MKVYLAGASYNRSLISMAEAYLSYIVKVDFTSMWYKLPPVESLRERHSIDILDGVNKSDVIVAFYPYGENGMLCEMSIAVGRGTPVIYFRNPEFADEDPLVVGNFFDGTDILKRSTFQPYELPSLAKMKDQIQLYPGYVINRVSTLVQFLKEGNNEK